MASKPNDPFLMPALIGGLVLLGATVFVLVSNLFSTIEKNSVTGDVENNALYTAQANANIAPLGSVVAVDKTVEPKARTGEEVYNSVCMSCHAAGTLGAPKIDDKSAWSARASNGLEGLLKNAINGIGAMPARGGDPTITDKELSDAILYMTDKAGLELADASGSADTGSETTEAASSTAASTADTAATTEPTAPEAPSAATAPEAPAAPETPAAPEKPAVTETAEAAPADAAPAAEVAAAAPSHAGINGEKIYKGLCFSCHDVGVAGAPKLGDVAAWTDRIAAGTESLYNNSINGKGAMPAKGGNPALSDDEIKAAVDYMVQQSQ